MIASHKPVNIFYFYDSVDRGLRDELDKHFINFKRQGLLTTWDDREITFAHRWTSIEEHVNEARIILFLLSPDFMLSDYSERAEVKRALERHRAGEARVIPVLLRPVHFENSPFGNLQVLPADARPVTTWSNRDEAFFNISNNIRKVAEEIRRSIWI